MSQLQGNVQRNAEQEVVAALQQQRTTTQTRQNGAPPPPQTGGMQQQRNMVQLVMNQEVFSDVQRFDNQQILEEAAREEPMNPLVHGWEAKKAEKQRLAQIKSEDERQYEEMKANPLQYEMTGDRILQNKTFVSKVLKSRKTVKCADGHKYTQQQLMQQVKDGDYSHIQFLDPVLLNNMAASYFKNLSITGIGQDSSEDDVVTALMRAGGVSALMNPLLRFGITMRTKNIHLQGFLAGKDTAFFVRLEDKLNAAVFAKTLTTKGEADTANGITDADVERNLQQRKMLLKTAYLAQRCRVKQMENGRPVAGNQGDYTKSIGSLFAVPTRTMVVIPHDTQRGSETVESYMGRSQGGVLGAVTGFFKRTSATHSVKRPTKRGIRDGAENAKELKTKNPFLIFSHQYGANIAVGGLGSNGLTGPQGARKIKNDGSCGHLYMHVQEGDETHDTCMLIGIESDAPGVINQTGHIHDWHAYRENFSNFGARAENLAGDRYGGRVLDVRSEYQNAAEFQLDMGYIDRAFDRMLRSEDPNVAADLELVANALSGKIMDRNDYLRIEQRIRSYS